MGDRKARWHYCNNVTLLSWHISRGGDHRNTGKGDIIYPAHWEHIMSRMSDMEHCDMSWSYMGHVMGYHDTHINYIIPSYPGTGDQDEWVAITVQHQTSVQPVDCCSFLAPCIIRSCWYLMICKPGLWRSDTCKIFYQSQLMASSAQPSSETPDNELQLTDNGFKLILI